MENAALLVCAAAGFVAVLTYVASRVRNGRRLRRGVFSNLDSAAEGGHFAPGEHLYGMTADDIAYDLTVYSVDFEDVKPETLAPYVREWLELRQRDERLTEIFRGQA